VQQFASSIIVGETTGVVNVVTGAISDLPAGVVANFKGRVIGSNAVNSNEFITLSQATSTSRLAISLTTTGSSGPATYNNTTGVFNIPEYAGTVNPSAREIQTYIATASQTTFTVTGGYTVGLVDVFINGVRLTSSDFVATNGTTVVLTVGTMAGNIVDIIKYTSGIVNSISGTGTTNELAYFTASTTIASLSTATYPSLTELSYVKGVTSSIQTQLNGKQSTLTNPVTGTGTTNYLPKFTGATTIGNSQVFDNGTNVGINTATPATTLEVNGVGLFGGTSLVGNTKNGIYIYDQSILSLAGTGPRPLTIQGQTLSIYTGNTYSEKLKVFENGNVVISTSPSDAGFKLDVNGTGRFSGNLSVIKSSGGSVFTLQSTATNGEAQVDLEGRNSSGTVRSATFKYDNTDIIRIGTSSNIGMRFETNDVARLTIANTGAATFSSSVSVQSVGIGVTIDDAGKQGYTITNSAAVRTYKIIAGIDGTSNTGFSIRNVTAGRNELLFTDAGAATFSSSVTSGSTLQANGNAFILPTLSGGGSGGGLYLGVYPDTQYTKQAILVERYVSVSGNYGRGSLHFCNRDTADANQPTLADSRMVITSSGNVGIGTTNPAGQLSGTIGLSIVNNTNAALGLSNGTNHWLNYLSGTTYRIWNNSVAEVMTLTYGGNVLIGTATDNGLGRLQVNGTITVAGGVRFSSSGADANRWSVYWNGGTGDLIVVNNISDIRAKKDFDYNIKGLETIQKLKPLKFTWKDGTSHSTSVSGRLRQYGFIAQETMEADDYLAWHNQSQDTWGIEQYESFSAVIVKAIQELKAELDELKSKN
jgi:hypothetical protein